MYLLLMLLFSTLCYGETNQLGALILTSQDGHGTGFEMEAELLKKGYDVHLVQVNTIGLIPTQEWAQTKLGKQFHNKHYEKLLFIAFGHGLENEGCHMTWKNMLELIHILEKKGDELFVNILTCYSGDIVDKWNDIHSGLGPKVKIFSTLSCPGKAASGYIDKPSFGQFITGNWYYSRQRSAVNRNEFKKLGCDATFEEVAKAVDDTPCKIGKNCEKLHIHRGNNEQLHSWNLLPVRLVENIIPGFRKEIDFNDAKCENPYKKEFNKTREITISLDPGFTTHSMDPIKNMKIENVKDSDGTPKDGPNGLEEIKPYSTILWINSEKKCNTQSGCNELMAFLEMKNMRRIKIGYHRGSHKTLLLTKFGQKYSSYPWDDDYLDDPSLPYSFFEENKVIIILACIFVPLGLCFVILIIYCCCYQERKIQSSSKTTKHKHKHTNRKNSISKIMI